MRNAILTGSEGQLGSVFIEELISSGFNVIGIDKNQSSKHNSIFYIKADISKTSKLYETINLSEFDTIDLLINNAGVSVFSPFEERNTKELDFVIDVNLKAPIIISQLLLVMI